MFGYAIDWALVTAIIATAISLFALYQTHRHKVLEARPWFAIEGIELETVGERQRLKVRLRHVSGGIALRLKFAVAIGDNKSLETEEGPALLPGDTVEVRSPAIAGPPIAERQHVTWIFTFDDEFQNHYKLEQTVDLRNKQISYVPSKL